MQGHLILSLVYHEKIHELNRYHREESLTPHIMSSAFLLSILRFLHSQLLIFSPQKVEIKRMISLTPSVSKVSHAYLVF
jgi:hypothetical protein